MEQKAAPATGIGCGGWDGLEQRTGRGGGAGFCHLNTSSARPSGGAHQLALQTHELRAASEQTTPTPRLVIRVY
jgi:hypothetical protein